MDTAATIALRLCQEMASTHAPNVGAYLGITLPDGTEFVTVTNAQLIPLWFPYCQWDDYLTQPAWDKNSTPGNQTEMPHPYTTAAEILGIAFLIYSGQMTLDQIAEKITDNPYIVLNNLYTMGGNLQTDAVNAMLGLGVPQSNDPYHLWLI